MGFAQWHSDGTEILNSSRPPATGNFCLGVWEKTGPSRFKLNHFALSSDLNGNMIGPANIRESVTLGPQSITYAGTFSIDQYDTSGNLLAHIVGEVKPPESQRIPKSQTSSEPGPGTQPCLRHLLGRPALPPCERPPSLARQRPGHGNVDGWLCSPPAIRLSF